MEHNINTTDNDANLELSEIMEKHKVDGKDNVYDLRDLDDIGILINIFKKYKNECDFCVNSDNDKNINVTQVLDCI